MFLDFGVYLQLCRFISVGIMSYEIVLLLLLLLFYFYFYFFLFLLSYWVVLDVFQFNFEITQWMEEKKM
jgi:hypothetical protein